MYDVIYNFNEKYYLYIPVLVLTILSILLGSVIMLCFIMPWHNYVQCLIVEKCGYTNIRKRSCMSLKPKESFQLLGALSVVLLQFGFTEPIEYRESKLKYPLLNKIMIHLNGPVFYAAVCLITLFIYVVFAEFNFFNLNMGITSIYQALRGDEGYFSSMDFTGILSGVLALAPKYIYALFFLTLKFVIKCCFISALVNLVPIPPLDTSRLLLHSFPERIKKFLINNEFFISFGVFILGFLFLQGPTTHFVERVVDPVLSEISEVFITFIRSIISVFV